MGSAKMPHSRIPPCLEDLDGGLVVLVQVHLDVDFLNPFVVFVSDYISYCPADYVASESLLVSAGLRRVEYHVSKGFPQLKCGDAFCS
jgi:hypothetical protein